MKKKIAIVLAVVIAIIAITVCVFVFFVKDNYSKEDDKAMMYSEFLLKDRDYVIQKLEELNINYVKGEDLEAPERLSLGYEIHSALGYNNFMANLRFDETDTHLMSYEFFKEYKIHDEKTVFKEMDNMLKMAESIYKEVDEDDPIKPSNPYSRSKFLEDADKSLTTSDIYYIPDIADNFIVEITLEKDVKFHIYWLVIKYQFIPDENFN